MKSRLFGYITIATMIVTWGCAEAPQPGQKAEQAKEPVAKVEQRIKTPMLKKPEIPAPSAPEAVKPEEEVKKEVLPGTPLKTPPIPSATAKPQPSLPKELAPVAPTLPEQIKFQPTLIRGSVGINVVIDASGSMNAPLGAVEKTKFETVKEALEDVLLAASGQSEIPRSIGMRVFGATSPVNAKNCKDTSVIAEVGPLNLNNLMTSLASVTPQGLSPITTSLENAASDFPKELTGDKIVLLIADGADTCERDPCALASKIHSPPQNIILQVIGFDVSTDDQNILKCIASNGGGNFQLARNEAELRGAIDQALNANVPYNLRLTITAGASPLPATITVLESGTSKVISKDQSFGSKIFKLNPGTYDILVEYSDSPEKKVPSKLLKGVEILGSTKVEQSINFDLGQISLSSIDNENRLVTAQYRIVKSGTVTTVAEVESGAQTLMLSLTPGNYDITAMQLGAPAEQLILTDSGVAVRTGESVEKTFRFQKGTLEIRAKTTQGKEMPFTFQITATGRTDVIASGAALSSGTKIALSPGSYELVATGEDPSLPASPRTKVTNISINAGQTTDLTVNFEMGQMILSAVNDKDEPIEAEFEIRDISNEMITARASTSGKEPATLTIPPGDYKIIAYSTRGNVNPKPSVVIDQVKVTADKPATETAKFILGGLRMRGMNAKEEAILTQFTLYRAGTEDVVSVSKPTTDWVVFETAPGRYDIKAVDMSATQAEKPSITLNDLKVEAGKTESHQSIFTAGKIKIIGRGPNNRIITVKFKIFQYGADTELINGKTGQDWITYEIPPGRYYLEAGYVDPDKSVLLKKWVNITVGDNEVVEQVLRF